ncbi:ParB/RepB/Spo0J family partition protein [Streptomyces sp. NPDC088707]|uniref:ParB/RepB/Spo0J family partition protein n=1 Tax=Streptomyces sp. NPDC088707 TaxID=3365871 RepID=UPI003824F264
MVTQGSQFWAVPQSEVNGEGLTIAVEDITANPYNDRDLGDLTGLADSIRIDGLVQDVTVMHTGEFAKHFPEAAAGITTKYVLAFGERRWRATQLIGLDKITAVLRNDLAPKIRRILFAENFHRKQLSPVEEARTFHRMHTEEGMSYREIADELSLKTPAHVSRRMELLKLPAELQGIVGTEGGPGVTVARAIGSELSTPEEQLAAWELMSGEEPLSLKEAVRRLRSGEAVPQGNNVPEPRAAGDVETSQEVAETSELNAPPEQAEPAPSKGLDAGDAEGPKEQKLVAPQKPATSIAKPGADRETAQRQHASADRDQTCLSMITTAAELSPEQSDALFARALLAPTQQAAARSRAQRWLREAGKSGFEITDTESYFEAVLSSGNADLIKTVTFATALAASEIRARDGRRQWDRHDAEHVRLLIDAGKHVPESEWERRQLAKYTIPFPNEDAADADLID